MFLWQKECRPRSECLGTKVLFESDSVGECSSFEPDAAATGSWMLMLYRRSDWKDRLSYILSIYRIFLGTVIVDYMTEGFSR